MGFKKIEYIESDGQQYIDTGVRFGSNTRIELSVSGWSTDKVSTTLFGSRGASNSNRTQLFITAAGVYRYYYNGSYVSFSASLSFSDKVEITASGGDITIGGNTLSVESDVFYQNTNMYLFAYYTDGSVTQNASLRLYHCKIYDGNRIVRNFIPVISDSGNCGLLDTLTDTFYTSLSGVSFIGGAEIVEVNTYNVYPYPFGYRRRLLLNTKAKKETNYYILDKYGVAIMDVEGNFYKNEDSWVAVGRPTTNGIAVSDKVHRFCISQNIVNHVCSTNSIKDCEYWGASGTLVSGIVTTTDSEFAKLDFDGSTNTDMIISAVKSSDGYFTIAPWSAAGLCRRIVFPNGDRGYLGACGEWALIQSKIETVNSLMSAIGGEILEQSNNPYYWTSTQYDSSYAWLWRYERQDCNGGVKRGGVSRVRAFCLI